MNFSSSVILISLSVSFVSCVRDTNSQYESTRGPFLAGWLIFANLLSLPAAINTLRNLCEPNEYFFRNHCYFPVLAPLGESLPVSLQSSRLNVTKICQLQHPQAFGVAVETKEENAFVKKLVSSLFREGDTIFTSGIREHGSEDKWSGWNLTINRSILGFEEGGLTSDECSVYFCINPGTLSWSMIIISGLSKNYRVICERPYKTNIQLEKQCLHLYRKSNCYNPDEHVNYCCHKDETGHLWFSCPKRYRYKTFAFFSCEWYCGSNGYFVDEQPVCNGSQNCYGYYKGEYYRAPVTRYARRSCPTGYWGNSSWYCQTNRKFLGTPDFSLCCKYDHLHTGPCRSMDAFLNVWIGCPSKKVIKKTSCPAGMLLDEAFVEWYCQENGSFYGNTPNYTNCNVAKAVKCRQIDRFGTEWKAESGTTVNKNCPPRFTGLCYWYCKETGKFDGPEPDCSRCVADWMNEITDKIKNQTNYEDVMEIMEDYTEREDLTIGYSNVLDLTAGCVSLFKHQVSECKLSVYENFLKGYSKILKNVAGNCNTWSNFSVLNRRDYSERILETTQTAAFVNLTLGNETEFKYNRTFGRARTDGFDFFVAFNPSVGSRFPLENLSESDWHLDLKEINQSKSNFAAVGLVMNHSLSSLMFPQGNQTQDLELNAPVITFKVGDSRNGEIITDSNVVVAISFKHRKRTRRPESVVIRRRLHDGEEPSGVYKSTLCFYYRDTDWTNNGCTVTFTSDERTNCTCKHLSTIGLLMSMHRYEPNLTLEVISTVSSGITIISLILALVVFYFFDKAGNDRLLIGKNLCFCLLLGHIMLLTVLDKKFFNIPDTFCRISAIFLHYIFMAAFAWMFVEGCHLYRMLVVIFDSGVDYRFIYVMIGYGMPFVVVGMTQVVGFILQEQPYGQDEVCWLKSPMYVWAFVGPVIILTSINFCILVIALKLALASKLRAEKSNFAAIMLWLKAWFSLSALLGITWLFGLAYLIYYEPLVYGFVFFNGLQGFFIFLFRCALSEQYRTMFCKKIRPWFWKPKLKNLRKIENVKSQTKVYAISGSLTESKDSGYDPGFEDGRKCSSAVETSSSGKKTKIRGKLNENSSGVDADVDIALTPAMSEAYLRNKMISRNFSVRKSKAKLLAESDPPELSYHEICNGN